MILTKKHINSYEYWYVSDTLYINRRRTLTKNKCLGRVDKIGTEQAKVRAAQFKEDFIQQEAEERARYWIRYIHNATFTPEIVKSMEALRTSLYRKKSALQPLASAFSDMAFFIDFIYNSNSIEGSRLARKEVEKLFQETSNKQNNEVKNTMKAKEYIDTSSFYLSLSKVAQLQQIIMAHEPSKIGYRDFDTIIVGNEPIDCPASEVKKRLKDLFKWYKENEFKLYPPELAFTFYYRFECIHPFPDGNGRTGRLLMNWLLKRARYHPLIVWRRNEVAHKNAFINSIERLHPFMTFMISQYKKTYTTYEQKLSQAITQAKGLNDFLSPTE